MQRTGVLFMQSQEFFGADSQIHASVMRHLPRDRFEVHCAVPADPDGSGVASVEALRSVPDLHIRPTDFGPSLEDVDRADARRRLVRRGIPMSWSLLGLATYVRRNDIRIVHCTEKPRDAILGSLVARLGGAECVIHVHVKAAPWLRDGVQRAMRRSAALIGVSDFVAESIRDLLGEGDRTHAVLNGLELDEWVAPERPVGEVRASLGIEPEAPVIVSASRLFRHKGQHELLEALPSIRDSFPDVRLLIVGADDPRSAPGEGSYSDLLHTMCDDLGLNEHVIFTGWRSDVRELMAASDLYAMPSFEEPFGMVFIESMYLRRPVVALDNGGTREVVDHGGSGLLCQRGDTAALAANVVKLLSDGELRRQMGDHGHERVANYLNSERMASEVADVYESVLADR